MDILKATEVNTGGGSMVTIIEGLGWYYVLVVSDEAVGAYSSEEAFWNGEEPLFFTWIKGA